MTTRSDSIRYGDLRALAHISLFQSQHDRAPYLRELMLLIGARNIQATGYEVSRLKRLGMIERDGRRFVIRGQFTARPRQ